MLKTDLDLGTEVSSTAGKFGLRLVTSAAGSGKSLIVLYRAQLLRRLFPHMRLLVLTTTAPGSATWKRVTASPTCRARGWSAAT